MKTIIDELEKEIKTIAIKNIHTDGFYLITVTAAFIKSYEFMKLSANTNEESKTYFTLGSLRGICEDFIVLNFLKKLEKEDRDATIGAFMSLKFQEALKRQHSFFDKERKFQPIIKITPENQNLIEKHKQDLKDIGQRTGAWRKNEPMPKILHMAESLGLKSFYEYFYTLSSETVHFNPRILLRMGWSEKNDMENFSSYYREYGRVYSTLLFLKFFSEFKTILQLNEKIFEMTAKLDQKLNEILRWPEPVTFEELNKEAPNNFTRIMYKIAAELYQS
ncbi:MAG: hypothetical protein HY305_04655 [Sphingobacteriales bacterium]|nr:hypothetical protein [Sphingobacteriales bacterium]